jgi:hypothetical protein
VEDPELIRNVMLMVAQSHQIDTHRLDPEATWSRCALRLVFGGVAVLVMLASGTGKNIQP